jgi:hypothetical protein
MPKAIHCPYFMQKTNKGIVCENGVKVESRRKTEIDNFIQRYCGDLDGFKLCKNARSLSIKYGEITETRGRKPYIFSAEALKKLINTFEKHGWKPGYYTDFECSRFKCYQKLKELGLIKKVEGKK